MSSVRPNCGHDCLEYLGDSFPESSREKVCYRSVNRGHLECLRYAHEHGCPWSGDTCREASWTGHLECLRYAHEQGCPWDEKTCTWASLGGHLECLRYAHEQGCPWDQYTCHGASRFGHIQCLRYAHERGCPWDEMTCSWASRNGQLECLRYAHEQGCPWDDGACRWATVDGYMECLRYALENGCLVPDFTTNTVNSTVVPYLHHRGVRLGANNGDHLKRHIREHVHRAWTLLRCVVSLLASHQRACERVYSPDGAGYREAEISFRRAIGIDPSERETLLSDEQDPMSSIRSNCEKDF